MMLVAGKLFVCYVAATPSADKILQAHLPIREGRGIGLPSTNSKVNLLWVIDIVWVTKNVSRMRFWI